MASVYPHTTTCPIVGLYVQPYQRQNNTVTWYPIKIEWHTNQFVEMRYTYSDFVRFSRDIHHHYNIKKSLTSIKKEFQFLKKSNQKYIDRQLEIENFCNQLLLLATNITCSDLFVSFFSSVKISNYSMTTLKRIFSLKPPTTTATTTQSSFYTSLPSPPTSLLSSEEDDIKFKIVYDYQNIIIIRVNRNISLDQLRIQVIQKFTLLDIILPVEHLSFSYCENARYSSASSILCSDAADTIISNEQHLAAMQTKWSGLLKITLRCIV
ncbi:hypothetical protein MFLAVUS_005005 [Mucor flavus]|uniref:PX domain-containing protein n=1 Tax=Mucor flavus TaxID=439312 RepID=A0ABP9YXH7_9FUNG